MFCVFVKMSENIKYMYVKSLGVGHMLIDRYEYYEHTNAE